MEHDNEIAFSDWQSRLLPYAYNILGDSMEAEDVVQEVLSHYLLNPADHIQKPLHYLVKSVINRSITEKKKIQVRKEKYRGEWLPAPVSTEEGIYRHADRNSIINYSLLLLLERLNAKERAAFILKETFDFAHHEIADVLETSEENSRQLYKRARKKLEPDIDGVLTMSPESKATIESLTDAILQADVDRLKLLLSNDVRSISDGGEKVKAARNIISGKDHVAKFLQAIYGKYLVPNTKYQFTTLNRLPAILFRSDGKVYRCMLFDIQENVIQGIYIVVNPDKLHAL